MYEPTAGVAGVKVTAPPEIAGMFPVTYIFPPLTVIDVPTCALPPGPLQVCVAFSGSKVTPVAVVVYKVDVLLNGGLWACIPGRKPATITKIIVDRVIG
jgi:hypothetical protein